MKKLSLFLITIFIFGLSATGHGSAEILLFEGIFERGIGDTGMGYKAAGNKETGNKRTGNKGTGTPVTQSVKFSGAGGEATLTVCNVPDSEKVSSATISINGNIVLGSSNFNQNVGCIEKTVNLNDGDNTLEVLLKSKPGGKISVDVLQAGIPGSGDVCDGDGTYPNTEIERIYVGANPYAISASFDGNYVYATHPLSDTLSVIPVSDDTAEIETIDVGQLANGISVSPDGNYVYVTHLDNKLSVISLSDNNTVIKTIAVGNRPWGVSVSPDGESVYVSNFGDSTVSVISTSEILTSDNPVIETITVGNKHKGISVSPDGKYVYVSNYDQDGTVSVIPISDDNAEIETIDVGEYPAGVSASPDGKYLYVSNYGENTVSVISICDDNAEIETIDVGEDPTGVSVSPDGEYVYVSNYVPVGTVSVFGFVFDDQMMNSF